MISLPPAVRGAPGRGRLWPQTPPRRVPRPRSINHSSHLHCDKTCTARLRADCVRPAETCEKSSAELFSVCSGASQTAIETRIRRCRADGQQKNKPHLSAHVQIQGYRAARTIRAKTCSGCTNTKWLPPGRYSIVSFGRHVGLNLCMCATARV